MEASEVLEVASPDLEVVLTASGVEVARTRSPEIWLSAMASITGAKPITPKPMASAESVIESLNPEDPLARLAKDLGLTVDELEAAAGPRTEAPFIHLDAKYWEALLSKPGYGRIAAPVLAATLLLLWNRHTKFGDVDSRMCAKILSDVGIRQKNPQRAFKNCPWLQMRGDRLQLNPTAISKAEALATAYCRP